MVRRTLLAAIPALILFMPAAGFCEGYGFYSWGRSWPTVGAPDIKELAWLQGIELDLQYDHFTFGLLFDSNPPPEELFGYRFAAGVDIALASFEGISNGGAFESLGELYGDSFDAIGYGFEIKFGYSIGLLRREYMRIWVGPAVRLNYNYLDQDAVTVGYQDFSVQVDPSMGMNLSAGGGIEAGINFKLTCDMRLELSGGFHYNFFGYYQDVDYNYGSFKYSETSFLMGQEPFAFVQLAVHIY